MPKPPLALILEDEPRYRTFLAEVVRGLNCSAATAGTASEARRIVASDPPDFLMLDLNLPVVDGITFLEEFRRTCPDAPVIIITGFGDLDSARKAIRLGVTEFLTKPCDLGQLEQAVDRALRRLVATAPDSTTVESVREPESRKEAPALVEVEREAILEALRRSGGNRSDAARKLGISRRSLYNKIDEYRREGFTVP